MSSPAAGTRLASDPHAPHGPLRVVRVQAPQVAPETFLRLAAREFPECDRVGHLWSSGDGRQSAGWGASRRFEMAAEPTRDGAAGGSDGNGVAGAPVTSPGPEEERATVDRLAEQAAGLWGELAGVDPLAMRLYGGLAFDPAGSGPRCQGTASAWSNFGAASFVLPRVGYDVEADGAWLHLVLDSPDDPACSSWRQRLEALADGLDAGPAPAEHGDGTNGASKAASLAAMLPDLPGILQWTDLPATDEWMARVEQLRGEVSEGRLQKVVSARSVELDLARQFGLSDLARIAARLKRHMPTCTCFAFLRNGSVFFGATPELLVRRRGGRIEAQALAGSIASDASPERRRALERQLLESDKERLEHDLVVRYLVERLDRNCGAAVAPSSPGVRALRNVLHLETPIRASLARTVKPPHVLSLVRALHPTPAVAGSPTSAALQAIRRTEDRERGWYAGPVGWFNGHGDGEFSLALRSCLAAGRKGLLYSGAGIVADSDPGRELAETNLKLDAILGAWG